MEHTPVCFYDNSYIASFLAYQTEEFRDRYLESLDTLLTRAEAAQIPVVGYIDASDSRDLVHMHGSVHGRATLDDSDLYGITDAALVAELLPGWGDRTPLMQCARHDGVSAERGSDFLYGRVGIVYLRLHRRTLPARVEIPLWIREREGLLDEVMDVGAGTGGPGQHELSARPEPAPIAKPPSARPTAGSSTTWSSRGPTRNWART